VITIKQRTKNKSRFITEYPEDAFISAVRELAPTTAREVSNLVGCGLSLAQKKLQELFKNETIKGKYLSGRWIYEM